jgi:hypothetical protein
MKWAKPELEQLERREAPTSFGSSSHVVPGPAPVGSPVPVVLGGVSEANEARAPPSLAKA